jgi:hypothetical protein
MAWTAAESIQAISVARAQIPLSEVAGGPSGLPEDASKFGTLESSDDPSTFVRTPG